MLLSERMRQSLADLKGSSFAEPRTVVWTVDDGGLVEADLTVVDSLSCALRELRVQAGPLTAASVGQLQTWAENLCQRVTYLLERLGPLEVDPEAQAVLVRSMPPTRLPGQTTYYEAFVQAPGIVRVRRYRREQGAAEREACDLQFTHEVFLKLVADIVAAIPAAQAA